MAISPPSPTVTVMVAAFTFPPATPVIVAVPTDTAVVSPVPTSTVATAELLVAQVTVRPVRVSPSASLSMAWNCCVEPGAW